MRSQMIIGTNGNQPFAIPDNKVSRRHAILTQEDNGQYYIIDNGSTNGTFIYNGSQFVRLYPNQPYPVNADTMIQLGPDTRFHIRRLLVQKNEKPQEKPKQEPKRIEISHLRTISDDYENTKLSLESKAGMVNGLRGCTILIMTVVGTISTFLTNKDADEDSKLKTAIICMGLAFILMFILLTLINVFNKKILKKKKENEQNYAINYKCPDCGAVFRGQVYENILAMRICPRCKGIFYDKNETNE